MPQKWVVKMLRYLPTPPNEYKWESAQSAPETGLLAELGLCVTMITHSLKESVRNKLTGVYTAA